MVSHGFNYPATSLWHNALTPEACALFILLAAGVMILMHRHLLDHADNVRLMRFGTATLLGAGAAVFLVVLYQMSLNVFPPLVSKMLRNNSEIAIPASTLAVMALFLIFAGIGDIIAGMQSRLPAGIAVLVIALYPFFAPASFPRAPQLFAVSSWCLAGAWLGAALDRAFLLNGQQSPEHFARQGFIGGAMAGFMVASAPGILAAYHVPFLVCVFLGGSFFGLFLTSPGPERVNPDADAAPGDQGDSVNNAIRAQANDTSSGP
jgi:hypothetical protein